MPRRTTIEIDEELLRKAQRALQLPTIRGTVEEALRRAAEDSEREDAERAERQRRLLKAFPTLVDLDVLASERMWR